VVNAGTYGSTMGRRSTFSADIKRPPDASAPPDIPNSPKKVIFLDSINNGII